MGKDEVGVLDGAFVGKELSVVVVEEVDDMDGDTVGLE